jgi:uncharacterized protein YjiS (DUF1127 family)
MTMMHQTAPASGWTGAGLAGRIARAIAGWTRRAAEADANRRAAMTLATMDAHLLRDIGIEREDAWRLATGERD